jgi:hypothetical protein
MLSDTVAIIEWRFAPFVSALRETLTALIFI